jgi:hypothetical protein
MKIDIMQSQTMIVVMATYPFAKYRKIVRKEIACRIQNNKNERTYSFTDDEKDNMEPAKKKPPQNIDSISAKGTGQQ